MAVLYNKTQGCFIEMDQKKDNNYSPMINLLIKENLWKASDEVIVTKFTDLPEAIKKCNHTKAIGNYLNMKEIFGDDIKRLDLDDPADDF